MRAAVLARLALDAAHRARALCVYRAALRRARRLPDPCARHYAWERLASGFRAGRGETSARDARAALGEVERWTRRMARALRGGEDLRTVLELSYGTRGRMKHLTRAREADGAEGTKTRRVTRFALPMMNDATGETYSLGYLFRALEERREDEDESLARQMRMLRLRVPRYFHPNGAATRATHEREEERDESLAEHVRVWPWEVVTAEDIASSAPTYGRGFMPPPADWEMVHLALLKTTFTPLARERMQTMDRRARRVYERAFGLERECLVRLEDVPGVSTADFQSSE